MAEKRINAADYPNLQAAVDALPEEGGDIFLPAGTYELPEELVVRKPNVALRGADDPPGGSAIVGPHPGRPAKIRVEQPGFRVVNLQFGTKAKVLEGSGETATREAP